MTSRRMKRFLVAFVALGAVCFSLGLFCERLIGMHLLPGLARPRVLLSVGLSTIGGVALAVQAVRTTSRIHRLRERAETPFPAAVQQMIHQVGFDSRQMVLITASQPQAFCYGFLRPRICLSTGLINHLSPLQLRAVLLHEDHHRLHYDPLRILLLDALAAALFFLPAVGDWCRFQKIQLELAADQHAVEQAGKPALAGALHHLLSHPEDPLPGGVAELSATEERVARLLGTRDPLPRTSTRSLLTTTIILLVLCMVIV